MPKPVQDLSSILSDQITRMYEEAKAEALAEVRAALEDALLRLGGKRRPGRPPNPIGAVKRGPGRPRKVEALAPSPPPIKSRRA